MIVIVYGVTGCGKTTIGEELAKMLELPFYDGDQFHPKSNKKKMNAGIPLTDEDRIPWLEIIANHLLDWNKKGGAVLACSALNEKYRKILMVTSNIQWILLDGSKDLIQSRLRKRVGHFMNPALLDSQLATLEKPLYGWRISVNKKPEKIVAEILNKINTLENLSAFGIIGMGVMGKSLALNLADTNTKISIFNRHVEGKEEKNSQ